MQTPFERFFVFGSFGQLELQLSSPSIVEWNSGIVYLSFSDNYMLILFIFHKELQKMLWIADAL